MSKRIRRLIVLLVAAVMTIGMMTVHAEGAQDNWRLDNYGWWYLNEDGSYPAGCWQFIDNQWYHFDNEGYMQVGWLQEGDTWYYLNGSGAMVTGWLEFAGNRYYMNSDGSMATGWIRDGNDWYYLDSSGAARIGWVWDGNGWYYLNADGTMHTGWLLTGGAWYYMTGSGAMATGWIMDNGKWYYLDGSGAMHTGWLWDGNAWYYLDGSGAMATGWVWDGAHWYYMNSSGAMMTGWIMDNNRWYYLNENGAMATGWIYDGNAWYFLNDDGSWVPEVTSIAGDIKYGGTYVLTSSGNNTLLVKDHSVYNGADVLVGSGDNSTAQKWVVQSTGDGYSYLRNLHSWKVLDLVNGNVQQSYASGADSQKWRIEEAEGGYVLVNHNGMYLSYSSGSAAGAKDKLVWNMQEVDPGTALNFKLDGQQTLGIRTFQVFQGNVTETSGYYNINTEIDLPDGGYYLSGGSNYSIGLKVSYVNTFLAQAGYLDWGYYGYNRYDSSTTWAVARFQEDHGLYADGVVDLNTWLAMGYSEYDFNHLGDYTTPLKVQAYGSYRQSYVDAMLNTANEYVAAGTGFMDGASGVPGTYVDCSGLIFQCLYAAGINPNVNIIDHARVVYEFTSNYLGNDWQMGVAVGSAEPGDLVFYGGSSINHVAIYAGNGMIVDAWPGVGVSYRNIYAGGNILKILRVF